MTQVSHFLACETEGVIVQPPPSTEDRKQLERTIRARIAEEPRRADLWIELAKLLSSSDQESDQRTVESCWQRALRLDPAIQRDSVLDESATEEPAESEVVSFKQPVLEQADSVLLDGFFASSSATDRGSSDSLFQFPFTCRPIVITGGEFCGTEELIRLLSGHSRLVTIEADGQAPEELRTTLNSVETGYRALIHAPAWEYQLDALAEWPGATVVWLDRETDERIADMTDRLLVLDRFGPWGVMRPWSVHPDGGPLAFERCLKQFEATGNAIPTTLRNSWERLQSTRPFRRSLQQAKWLAPEYCRMLAHFWQTYSSETSIRITTNELAENPEATVRRLLAFTDLAPDEAHILDAAAAEAGSMETAGKARAILLWS